MTRWLLTKEQIVADEIHRRAKHIGLVGKSREIDLSSNWGMVGFTAEWMTNSRRAEDPDFDSALSVSESTCMACDFGRMAQEVREAKFA